MSEKTLVMVLLAAVLSLDGANALGDAAFKITTKREDDRVVVDCEENQAVFSVHSPFGISQAVIARLGVDWPEEVTLRLHLQGLENFKITNGTLALEASVSSQGDQLPVRLARDGGEASSLDDKDPWWMPIHRYGADGQPFKTNSNTGGYFELQMPRPMFEENPPSITLTWIDFYR